MKLFVCKDTDGGTKYFVAAEDIRKAIDLYETANRRTPEVIFDMTADGERIIVQGLIEPTPEDPTHP